MGDIFFVIRMAVYTVILVIVMQVKIGPTTLEEKVIQFTHNSSFSENIQNIAEGAVKILGIAYNKTVQNVDTAFSKNHIKENIPGRRLEKTFSKTKNILRETFGAEEEIKEQAQEALPEKEDYKQ